jgi:hypothetical protein
MSVDVIADPMAIEPTDAVGKHRNGGHLVRKLFHGVADSPDNFECSIYSVDGYFTPRHSHHFEQIRYGLTGSLNIEPNRWLRAGHAGYFPAGAPYGPQRNDTPASGLIVQFGGPDGQGFTPYRLYGDAFDALSQHGEFSAGLYRDLEPASGKPRQRDAMDALEEYIRGKTPSPARPRYDKAVITNPDNFGWQLTEHPGVLHKTLGTFSERQAELKYVSVSAGSSYELPATTAMRIGYMVDGRGAIDDTELPQRGVFQSDSGQSNHFEALSDTVLFLMVLPPLPTFVSAANSKTTVGASS